MSALKVVRVAVSAGGKGKSIVVCLPIIWARAQGIKPGSKLVLEFDGSKILKLYPQENSNLNETERNIR